MGAGHSHTHGGAANERSLKIALALTGSYLVAEVVGGLLANSLALLSDAAHMLTDVMALFIALMAIRIGKRPADRKRTFGYYRFEILAAALNAAVLFVVGFFIMYEAWMRFRNPPEIHATAMLYVAAFGLVVNLVSMRVLQSGASHSLNMKGAYLEVWSDLLSSVAVIIAAIVIRFTGWWQADPVLALLIGLWVLPRTWTLLSQSVNILLEGIPEGVELSEVEAALLAVPGVCEVHELHVWAITSGRNSLTAHLSLDDSGHSEQAVRQEAARVLRSRFNIAHSTVQVEVESCQPAKLCSLAEAAEHHSHEGEAH